MAGWEGLPDLILLEIYSNLSFSDKFSASATCKRWRELLFHPNNWSHASFDFAKQHISKENFLTLTVAHFIRKCTVHVADGALESTTELYNHFDVENFLQRLVINRNLTELTFLQSFVETKSPDGCTELKKSCNNKLESCPRSRSRKRRRLWLNMESYLTKLIGSSTNHMEHLSLGCVPTLVQSRRSILRTLVQHQSDSLRSLHISHYTAEGIYPVDVSHILSLKYLQHLSLDMIDITDSLLVSLAQSHEAELRSLSINIWEHVPGHRNIRDRTWMLVSQSFPRLKLMVNMIRCPTAVQDIMSIISPSMPLTHLRMFLCDELYVSGLHHVARYQSSTLESFQVMESMTLGPMYYEIDVNEQDPFVMMAWRCSKLTDISIIGVAIQEHDVLAIARLRGKQLDSFEVLDECITPYLEGESPEFEEDFAMPFESFCEEVSASVGKEWQPLSLDDLHSSLYATSSDSGVDDTPAFLYRLLADYDFLRSGQ